MTKKLLALILALVFALSLAACAQQEEEETIRRRRRKSTVEENTSQVEILETYPEMTISQLMAYVGGIWVMEDTIEYMYEDRYSFAALVISEGYCGSAYYPGEYDRMGKITEIRQLDDKKVELLLVYEAGEHMGDYYEETQDTVVVDYSVSGKLTVNFGGRGESELIYGGTDFEAANKMVNHLRGG